MAKKPQPKVVGKEDFFLKELLIAKPTNPSKRIKKIGVEMKLLFFFPK